MAGSEKPGHVRMGVLDRVLSVISPGAARRRYGERIALDVMRRGYDGGKKSRTTDGWVSISQNASADVVIGASASLLRDRSRDLVRNNALAAQAVQVLVNNMIGPGIQPRAVCRSKAVADKVNKLWAQWVKECDFYGHTTFSGLQALAARQMIEAGDVFALRITSKENGGVVPLKIALREIDHLDSAKRSVDSSVLIDQGIEFDSAGRKQAYWLLPEHPGGAQAATKGFRASERVPVGRVAHLFEQQRLQSRGVPWVAPAMIALRDLGDWQHSELVRKKTEACLVGIVFGADEDDKSVAPVVQSSDGEKVEEFRPGMIAYARGGKDIKFNTPGASTGVYEWTRVQMHLIASGFRVPYALMTGDLSQNNFASSRVGLNEFRRMIELVQWQTIIPQFCEPVWRWFIEACQLAGHIPVTAQVDVEWAPPRFEMVNPLQDVQADLLEVRAGFASPQQMIGKRGYDAAVVLAEWLEHATATDLAELVFDSDPRKVSKGGQVQQVNGAAVPDGQADNPTNDGGSA
jgi:lambda family phage portal protein